jgi:hypothetical protein
LTSSASPVRSGKPIGSPENPNVTVLPPASATPSVESAVLHIVGVHPAE